MRVVVCLCDEEATCPGCHPDFKPVTAGTIENRCVRVEDGIPTAHVRRPVAALVAFTSGRAQQCLIFVVCLF